MQHNNNGTTVGKISMHGTALVVALLTCLFHMLH